MSGEHASISHRQTTVEENQINRASATLDRREGRSHLAYTLDEFLEPEKQVLGVEFPEQADEYEEKD